VKTFSLPLREELKNRKLFRFSLFQLLRYRTYIGQFPFQEDGEILVEIDPENRILKIKPTTEKRA